MTLKEYFEHKDSPAAESPVGKAMVNVLAKYPGITFKEARAKAHEFVATGYRMKKRPVIYVRSAEDIAASAVKAKEYWKKVAAAKK